MKPARSRSSGAVVVLGAVLGLLAMCVVLWILRGLITQEPPAAALAPVTVEDRPAPPPTFSSPPPPMPALQVPSPPQPPSGNDASDSCRPVEDASIPADYESTVADGVIVAWPPSDGGGPAVQAVAISYLIKGLLTEAAALTGTTRREQVTVVVYPSEETMRLVTHAPAWAGGIYNGAFVAVPAKPSAKLGVDISTLRHELMHAQLHVAVGCMPAWFNEGVAMYYQGAPPVRTWLRMLRGPDSFDIDSFRTPSYVLLPSERADVAYAESLAMVVYLVEHAGDIGIKNAIQSLRTANHETPRGGLDLWNRLYPGIGHRAVLDTLARKMFGVARATDLDGVLQGAVCCRSMRSLNDLGCRGAPLRGDRRYWVDETSHAFCMSRW